MNNINKVVICGQLMDDPRPRPTLVKGTSNSLTVLRVATNIRVVNFKGEETNDHQEHEVAVWGKDFDAVMAFKKGQLLYIEGRLQYSAQRYDTRIIASLIRPA